jgi:hypothetical protein
MALSVPLRTKKYYSLIRLSLDQVFLKQSKNLTAELLISGTFFGVNANLTTSAYFYNPDFPSIFSTLSLGIRLPAKILLMPQVQYDFSRQRFVSAKIEAERQFSRRGNIKLAYENNFAVNIQNVNLSLRYNLSFAQTGFSALYGRSSSSFVQSLRGSLMVDPRSKWVGASNMTNVGKGGLVVIPFLDLNVNGKRDPGEPKVPGLNLRLTGGRTERNTRDSTIRIFDLEPYTNYFIELERSSFDNVAWQIRQTVIGVAIDPNQFKIVEIPVAVMGEASGMVYLKNAEGVTGLGLIRVLFFREDSTLVTQTLSEPDGYFSFLGLSPGKYHVRLDSEQLRNINMYTQPDQISFTIEKEMEGGVADGLDFVLSPHNIK